MVFDRKPTSILPLFQSYSTVRGYGSWTEATKDGTVRSWDTIVRFTGAKRVGAGDGIRTRDINLGKVALYQLSYSREAESIVALPARHCQTEANKPRSRRSLPYIHKT